MVSSLGWAGLLLLLFHLLPAHTQGATATDASSPCTTTGSGSSGLGDNTLASGASGSGDLCPEITPTPATPEVYIELNLLIAVDKFKTNQTAFVRAIASTISQLLRESEVNESLEVMLTLDEEGSSGNTTIVRMHLASSSGTEDSAATEDAYYYLTLNEIQLRSALKESTGIDFLELVFVAPSSPTSATTEEPSLIWWDYFIIVLGCTAAALAPVLIIIVCCCKWRSHKRDEEKEKLLQQEREREAADSVLLPNGYYQLQQRRELVRKVARVGFQSRVQVQSRPLTMEELDNLLQNPATLRSEYSSIPSNLVTMAEVPPGAEDRNRYKDILPNPHTRVALFLKFGVANSDYINANYIRGYRDASKAYIATQGPLLWTVDDFWRMVWEQKSSIIVMVTGLEEKRIVKCAQYWPDSQVSLTASYGELDVTLKKRSTSHNYTITQYHLRHRERLVSRDITHFWFTAWPDHGVPTSTQPALDFLQQTRRHTHDIPAPIIVHCSAGIGRTGVFIGADIGMTQLEMEGEVDVLKIVSTMRQDRGGMVQTEQQYVFLYQLLFEYAKQLKQQPNGETGSTVRTDDGSQGTADLVLQNNYTMIV